MVTRNDIVLLGLSASITGGLVGGLLLGCGGVLVVEGANIGWLLMIPAAPVSGAIGWLMGRRLAAQIGR
jgi:hypothetical protein